jgi:HSP20 family protein
MNNLVPRNNLFQDLFDFRRDFDQIFNRMVTGWPWGQARESEMGFVPAVEAYMDKDRKVYHCRMALPGVDAKDVQIHAQGNTLTVTGERKENRSTTNANYWEQEISYGAFERTLSLPEGVDVDNLNAEYHNGLLEITAPVAASALPRRVEIKAGSKTKEIAA